MDQPPATHVAIEWLDRSAAGPGGKSACAVARVRAAGRDAAGMRPGDLVLAPLAMGDAESLLPAGSCIVLPSTVPGNRVQAIAPLALSLWIWDVAGLEPGEAAVFTSGSALDAPLAIVAGWRSARDVVRLVTGDRALSPLAGVIDLAAADAEATAAALAAVMREAPGSVAALLTGRADVLDLVLESAPMWARIVLAADAGEAATIDFYTNVHRKGCRLISVPATPAEMLEPRWRQAAESHVARAARILEQGLVGLLT